MLPSALLLLSRLVLAADPPAAPVPFLRSVVWRASAGVGCAARSMGGTSGRILVGRDPSRLRLGLDVSGFSELGLFVEPAASISSGHLVAGWELLPRGSFSALLYAGGGVADTRERGVLLEEGGAWGVDRYEEIRESGPSAIGGIVLATAPAHLVGLSSRDRRRGLELGLVVGGQAAAISQGFFLVELGFGSW